MVTPNTASWMSASRGLASIAPIVVHIVALAAGIGRHTETPIMSVRHTLDRISRSPAQDEFRIAKIRYLGIKVVPPPPEWDLHSGFREKQRLVHLPINCFAFALGLQDSKYHRAGLWHGLGSGHYVYFASHAFMSYLLRSRPPKNPPTVGDLVVYFSATKPEHAGVLIGDGKIRSKWGRFKPIFEHALWDVPQSYGPKVRYFHPVPFNSAEQAFLRCFPAVAKLV